MSGGICILSETFHPMVGGTQTQMRLLAGDLIANGFNVTVVTRRSKAELPCYEEFEGMRIHRVRPVGQGQRKRWGMMFASIPKLAALRREYDTIFVTGFRALGISGVLVSKLLGKKCILRAVSSGEMSGEFFRGGLDSVGLKPASLPVRLFIGVRNCILRRADRFVAQSAAIADELAAQRVKAGKVRIIPNGVDTGKFHPADAPRRIDLRRKLDIAPDRTIVVYTGRLVTYKGLPLLVEIWKEIAARFPSADLLLVGSEANDLCNCEKQLRDFVAANGLDKRVRFTGNVSNVHEYLQAADAFVLPTENEVFSNAIIEAMACGLPVISTAVGGLRDIVTNDVNGLVIGTNDRDGLRDALARLLGDNALAARLGAQALKTVQERYSRQIVTAEYIRMFREPGGIKR